MSDESAARWVYEKALTLKNIGNYKDAVRILCEVSKSRYSPTYVSCIDLLIELYFRDIDAFTSRKVMAVMRDARKKISDAQQLEFETTNIVDILFKHLYKLCDDAHQQVSKITTNPSENAIILAAFAGVPLSTRASEFFLTPCKQIVSGVAYELFTSSVLGTSRKVYAVYLSTALQFIEHCKKFAMTSALEKAAESIVKMITRAFLDPIHNLTQDSNLYDTKQLQDVEMELDRNHFYKSDTAVAGTVKVLSVLLLQLSEAGRWRQVSSTLVCLIRLTRTLEERERYQSDLSDGEHAFILRTLQDAYEVMAKTFWVCSNYNNHAYCLIKMCDGAVCDEERLHKAFLATLCCTNDTDEVGGVYKTQNIDVSINDGTLFDNVDTSRRALTTRLLPIINGSVKTRPGSEAAARNGLPHQTSADSSEVAAKLVDAQVLRLMDIYNPNVTDFAGLHAQLSAMVQRYPYLAPYDEPLRHIILHCQLKHLASQSNLVDASSLAMHESKLTQEEYVHTIEPTILADEAVPVEINSKTWTLSFHNATRSNLLSAFQALAESANMFQRRYFVPRHTQSGAEVTAPGSTASGVAESAGAEGVRMSTAQLRVSGSDVSYASERTRRLHLLQTMSISKIDSRSKMKADQELQSKREVAELRQRNEEERRLSIKQRQIEQLRAEYAELERQERQRVVVRRLREKYKNIQLDNSIAVKSSSSFEDEVTQKLAAMKRSEAESKRRAMLCSNLLESALRRLEIPKRKEQEEHNMEQRRVELADSRKNFLFQHQQEFERRQKEKEVLRVFVDDVRTFEKKMLHASGVDKSSKRDEQESIIQQEMRRLEAQA